MAKIGKSTIRREIVLAAAYPFFVIIMLFLWVCPVVLRKKLEQFAGKLYYKFGHKARQIALDNLKTAYGKELSEQEIEQRAKAVFTNVAGAFLDFFAKVYVKNPEKYFKMVEVLGEDNLKAAYSKGKGVICLVPHISSWELSAVTPPMLGYPTIAASKPIKGFLIQKSMVWFRKRRGMVNFERGGSYKMLAENLKQGKCLILMIDQDTNVKSCYVNFFGKEAYTPLGASRLAFDTEAAVVPMAMSRKDTGKYLFEILPELPFIQTGNRESDLISNTQNQTACIENIIRKNPEQWVWMHRRYKTQRK
jgi:KDO2-lipid IV(A) lauroyltransferase